MCQLNRVIAETLTGGVLARGRARLIDWLSRAHPVLVGEWSAGLDPRAYAGTTEADRP